MRKSYFNNNYKDSWPIKSLDISIVKVNPKTSEQDDNPKKNTKIEYWLEGGLWNEEFECYEHDIRLDCGAETFEEAFIEYSKLVKKYYDK